MYRVDRDGVLVEITDAPSCCFAFDVAADAAGNVLVLSVSSITRIDAGGTKTVIAGIPGTGGYCGDGGPATSACLHIYQSGGTFDVGGLAVDASGAIFVADVFNNRIRRIDTAGVITTVAGNGSGGFCGDEGPATGACLDRPNDVAVDASGNLYILDSTNARIRKVDTAGTITTILSGYQVAGIASDSAGNVFASDKNTNTVLRIDTTGAVATYAGNGQGGRSGDGGPATSAKLKTPKRLAIDADGNLYIGDFGNQVIRKVDPLAGLLFTERVGCKTIGQVTLATPASPSALTVFLSSDNPNVSLPASVTIPAGGVSKKFPFSVTTSLAPEIARISANFGAFTRTSAFAIRPPRPMRVTFDPKTTTPGNIATGRVTLNCPATLEAVELSIESSTSGPWHGSVPATVTVPLGASSATFDVMVDSVGRPSVAVRFGASANGETAQGTLKIQQK